MQAAGAGRTDARWQDARSTFLIASLIASLLLVGGLAWQAIEAARSQQDTAQQLLADYAAVAADELMRRSTVEVGYYGVHALMTELKRRLLAGGPRALPRPEDLAYAEDEGLRRAATLVERCFYRSPQGVIAPDGSPSLLRAVGQLPASAADPDAPFTVLHRSGDDDQSYRLVFASGDGIGTFGFAMRLAALPEWFERAMGRGALVPHALGGGAIANDRLDVRVIDAAGVELFARGTLRDPHIERAFGTDYGGLFQGLSVRIGVDPALARQLVVGGVSPQRVPALLALLVTTVGLVLAVTLQIRRERALLRMRTDFVARVSHELRTPLAQIRLFADTLLLERARSADERDRCLGIIQREAGRLSHLVDNVLLVSRRERAPGPAATPYLLAPIVADVVEEFRPSTRAGLDLRTQLDESCHARIHPDSLRQVLLNLLENAVKYGAEPITVRLAQCGRLVRLSVEDCGAGVPDAEKDCVWKEFYRLERDVKSAAGSGIGLAVVHEIVAAHDGRCALEDVESGGARLIVDLPACEPRGAAR